MKKIIIILSAALTMAAVSCNKENTAIENNDNRITELVASIEGRTPDTKMTFEKKTEGGMKFEWENGDEILVFPAKVYDATTAPDAIVPVKFSYSDGVFTAYEDDTYLEEGKQYYAIFGYYDQFSDFNQGTIQAVMRHANEGTIDMRHLPMVSDIFTAVRHVEQQEIGSNQVTKDENTTINFHHICGVLEFVFVSNSTATVSNIRLADANGLAVRGGFSIGFNQDGSVNYNSFTRLSTGGQYSNISDSNTYNLTQTPQSIYFPIFPGTYSFHHIGYDAPSAASLGGLFVTESGKAEIYKAGLARDLVVNRAEIRTKETHISVNNY